MRLEIMGRIAEAYDFAGWPEDIERVSKQQATAVIEAFPYPNHLELGAAEDFYDRARLYSLLESRETNQAAKRALTAAAVVKAREFTVVAAALPLMRAIRVFASVMRAHARYFHERAERFLDDEAVRSICHAWTKVAGYSEDLGEVQRIRAAGVSDRVVALFLGHRWFATEIAEPGVSP